VRSSSRPTGRGGSARLRDIAERLGVSIGTVDRALNGRGRISADTRARVLEAAAALGYRPNLAARYLSARRPLTIAVCLPLALESFYGDVRAGLADAAAPFAPSGLRVSWHDYPRLGVGEAGALRAALLSDPSGIVLAPGDPSSVTPMLAEAAERRVPVVCVTTDAPAGPRLSAIGVDPRTSGALVGELIGRMLGGTGTIAVVGGSLATSDHAGKVDGLADACRAYWPRLHVAAVVEAHDDEREARTKTRALLEAQPRLGAIYVATANSVPVLKEVVRARRERLTVVTTDVFPALVPFIERGLVAATIHQRPRTQGQLALDTLRRYLVDRIEPAASVRLSPHVVMRSNLHLFATPEEDGGRV
jgi:LacI family transcriptional regulator